MPVTCGESARRACTPCAELFAKQRATQDGGPADPDPPKGSKSRSTVPTLPLKWGFFCSPRTRTCRVGACLSLVGKARGALARHALNYSRNSAHPLALFVAVKALLFNLAEGIGAGRFPRRRAGPGERCVPNRHRRPLRYPRIWGMPHGDPCGVSVLAHETSDEGRNTRAKKKMLQKKPEKRPPYFGADAVEHGNLPSASRIIGENPQPASLILWGARPAYPPPSLTVRCSTLQSRRWCSSLWFQIAKRCSRPPSREDRRRSS